MATTFEEALASAGAGPDGMSPIQQELVVAVVRILVFFAVLLGLFSGMTYVERRVLAFMQFRLGPNRTGPWGLFQPIADGIKLFFKEEVIPQGAHKWLFVAAPAIALITAFLAIAVVPYGGQFTMPSWGLVPEWLRGRVISLQIADLDVGVLFLFAISSLGVYGIVIAGWAANNKYSLIGGLRSSAQMFSYELALGLSWVGLIMRAGSFRIGDIVASQAGGFWKWNLVLQFPAFAVYVVAATAEVNRTPFDLPEAETELVAGYHTEYSSMRFALLQMAEYVNMITASAVGASLFFGGWHFGLPGGARLRALVLPQDGGHPLLLHLAARDAAPVPLRPAHALRVEGPGPRGHGLDLRGRGGAGGAPPMTLDLVVFYVFAGLALGSAVVMVAQRNPTYSAFSLIVTLVSLSAIFGLLGSPFIAVLQVVVYAGAIMVLFLFVLMLLNVKSEEAVRGKSVVFRLLAVGLGVLLVVELGTVLAGARFAPPAGYDASARAVSRLLFSPQYLYVFEATSILILAALVGSVALAKRDL